MLAGDSVKTDSRATYMQRVPEQSSNLDQSSWQQRKAGLPGSC